MPTPEDYNDMLGVVINDEIDSFLDRLDRRTRGAWTDQQIKSTLGYFWLDEAFQDWVDQGDREVGSDA